MGVQEIFIGNLKKYRKKAGLTQAQLSVYIDKSFNYINGLEGGVFFPPPDVIDQMAEALKITPDKFFTVTQDPVYSIQPISQMTAAEESQRYNTAAASMDDVDGASERNLEELKENIRKEIDEGIDRAFDLLKKESGKS